MISPASAAKRESKKSTLSSVELFVGFGEPGKPAPQRAVPKRSKCRCFDVSLAAMWPSLKAILPRVMMRMPETLPIERRRASSGWPHSA